MMLFSTFYCIQSVTRDFKSNVDKVIIVYYSMKVIIHEGSKQEPAKILFYSNQALATKLLGSIIMDSRAFQEF